MLSGRRPAEKEEPMSFGAGLTTEAAVAAFDEHLHRARGLREGTRMNYTRFVRAFLEERFPDGRVEAGELDAHDVVEFIGAAARRYQPRTLELVATSLRSFFRFLRGNGLGAASRCGRRPLAAEDGRVGLRARGHSR